MHIFIYKGTYTNVKIQSNWNFGIFCPPLTYFIKSTLPRFFFLWKCLSNFFFTYFSFLSPQKFSLTESLRLCMFPNGFIINNILILLIINNNIIKITEIIINSLFRGFFLISSQDFNYYKRKEKNFYVILAMNFIAISLIKAFLLKKKK